MVAREAQHQQVVFRIIATAEDAQSVMDVELAFEARDAADLTAPASRRNKPAAPGWSELGGARPAIVRFAKALAQ